MSGHLSPPGAGQQYSALGITVRVRAGKSDTDGAVDVFEAEFPPGVPFPAHVHRESDEAFYVIDGEVTATIGASSHVVKAGTFAFAPRGTLHGFSNEGGTPARVLAWQWPSPDVVGFLQALAALPPDADEAALGPILAQYDVQPGG